MNCDVIKDLLPLYADNCCSQESMSLVEEHLCSCDNCKAALESMQQPLANSEINVPSVKTNRISLWKASVLQSVLFLVSFAVITVAVAMEAYTPTGPQNGFWAYGFVVPATGFMLSLTNWYFVRHYKSRRSFAVWSFAITAGITSVAFLWIWSHYGLALYSYMFLTFLVTAAVLCVLSPILANIYSGMLGKE